MSDLTLSDYLKDLRRPFTGAAVRFKPQTVTRDKSKALASFYIDARLAAERLNAVVGPENWTDTYRPLADGPSLAPLYFPVECSLTVCGVVKTDVGQGANTTLDDKAFKSAYSDAFKRAAVKFGVGAYLYSLPNEWAPVRVEGDKVKGFTQEGEKQIRGAYVAWLDSAANEYGAALEHGSVGEDDPAFVPPEDARTELEQQREALRVELYDLAATLDAEAATREQVGRNFAAHADDPGEHLEWMRRQIATMKQQIAANEESAKNADQLDMAAAG